MSVTQAKQPVDAAENTGEKQRNWVSTKLGKLVAASVLTLEMNPITNDGARYALLAATYGATRNPELAAAVYGASTLAYEGVGGVVAADVLDTPSGAKLVDKSNKVLDKIGASKFLKTNTATEAAVAIYGGTPAVTFLKHRQNPERTRAENRRYATLVSLGISAVCAAEGFAITEGIHSPDALTLSIAGAGVGGFLASWRWARKKMSAAQAEAVVDSTKKSRVEQSLPPADNKTMKAEAPNADIRYDLSEEEVKKLEQELVAEVKAKFPQEGLYPVWMRPHNRFSNIVRASEAKFFPEVDEVSEADEARTLLLALVDTRPFANRVVHGATVSGMTYEKDEEQVIDRPDARSDSTGFVVIDQLVEQGNFTPQQFRDYYAGKGIDVDRSIAVETNMRIGPKTERFNGFTPAQLAYLCIFKRLEKRRPELNKAAVFTTINRVSVLSFHHFGMEYEPLMGRKDLKTPEAELGKEFLPVAIPYNQHNIELFNMMGQELPEILL